MEFGIHLPPTQEARWGRWLLAIGISVAVVVLLIVGLSGGDDTRHQEPESRDPKVVVVPNSAVDSVPTENDEELILLPTAPRIDRGDFLTTKPGPNARRGFLLKAKSVEESDDETTVATEAASLYEAVPSGSLLANPSDFTPEPGLLSTTPAPVEEKEEASLVPAAFHQIVGFPGDLLGHLRPILKCDGPSEELKLKPSFTPDFHPYFDMRWNDKAGLRKRIEAAEAGILGELRAAVMGSVDGTFDCKLKRKLKIPLFKAVAPAGPVPVPVQVYVTVEPSVNGNLGSKVEGTIEIGLDGFAQVEYGDGGLHPSGTLIPKLGFEPPKIESRAEAGLGVTPEIVVAAGWKAPWLGELAASARLSLPTTVKLSYDALAERPVPEACFDLDLKGTLRFDLPKPLERFSPKKSAKQNLLHECGQLGGTDEDKERDEEPPPPEAG
jgi:hypothetical protein